MANPTTNFGWQMPTSTDLVTDLPADFEVFGQAVDTALVDLKGGTTGQVLSKASNTDMDFSWVAQDDSNAIQNAIVDAKGDLIAASAADTPARLAVGNNGETLVADSSTSTGLRYTENYAAGKNKIINGDFGIWQRGTSINTGNSDYFYGPDRWAAYFYASNTTTISQQTFSPGAAPVAGYEGQYFARFVSTNTATAFRQSIEDVRTFAGETITVSFWAKAASAITLTSSYTQFFGSGGSSPVDITGSSHSITTSWVRYSGTVTVPSISGKTIGTNSAFRLIFAAAVTSTNIDIWGVQLEAGSVATAFQTATGTIQGELAACQRYFYNHVTGATQSFGIGYYYSASEVSGYVQFPVTMRTTPTLVASSGTNYYNLSRNGGDDAFNSLTIVQAATTGAGFNNTTEASGTAGQAGGLRTNNASTSISFSSEL
jgi:hypothetical protein